MIELTDLFDPRCQRKPEDIPFIVRMAASEDLTPAEWVWENEGTLNTENGHFACDECYIALGMPSAPGRGWKMP